MGRISLSRFENAVRADEMSGSAHPQDRAAIEQEYQLVREQMAKHIKATKQENKRLRDALVVAEEILAEASRVLTLVPIIVPEVAQLGRKIGFGAMMTCATTLWREELAATGPAGGEFVSGPCRTTVENALATVRGALRKGAV